MLITLGLSHRTAPVAVRERLAYPGPALAGALEHAAGTTLAPAGPVGELAILATCGRTELVAMVAPHAVGEDAFDALTRLVADTTATPAAEFLPHAYRLSGSEAFAHLCRVAAGLDSVVLGESEILGQVASAHAASSAARTLGPGLRTVFERALRAGRRARAETGICRHPASVSSEAVRLAAETVGSLADARVLVVGTGQMARLAGEALRARGVSTLAVVSRTREHAEALAAAWTATPLAWHDLATAIRDADVVVTATGAPHAVVTAELVAEASRGRAPGRPLLFLDIAMPRDVEPSVRTAAGVQVYDLDDLQERLEGNLDLRRRETPRVERIVAEEVAHYEAWRRGWELRPVLTAMHQRAEEIRRRELARALHGIDELDPLLRERIEHLSHALVRKLLHEPTRRLRGETDPGRSSEYLRATRDLFALDGRRDGTGG